MQSKTIGLPSYNIRKKTYSDGSVELTSYSLIRKRHKLENQEKIIKPKTDLAIKTDRQKYGKTVAHRIRDYGLSPWLALFALFALFPFLNFIVGLYFGIKKEKLLK